jgi:menaquinone-9 beta-reductase
LWAMPGPPHPPPPQPGKAAPPQPGKAAPPQPGKAAPPQPGKAAPPQRGKAAPLELGTVAPLERLWDAIVVGAGPAGSCMAHQLAGAGARVLLLDKAAFPRSKPCGCCLNALALASLEQMGLGDLPRDCSAVALGELKLSVAGAPPVSIAIGRSAALSREQLDVALVQAAVQAGAAFVPQVSARLGTVDGAARTVHLHAGIEHHPLRARMVIAADGVGGTLLRDEPDFQPSVSRRSLIGAAVTLAADAGDCEYHPGVIWMTCASGGYVGVVRLAGGALHVAAAMPPSFMRACGGPGPAAAAILQAATRPPIHGLAKAHWRGTPALTRQRRVEGERLLVVGDAAGYVEPFTGEGIGWAMMSALSAAPLALSGIGGEEIAGRWSHLHGRLILPRQRLCSALAWSLRRPRLARSAARVAARLPTLVRPVLRLIEARPPVLRHATGGAS